jgi:16S rRNA (guanine1207-N2)-methyltransferase
VHQGSVDAVDAAHAEQYFEAQPAAPSRPHTVSLALPDHTVELTTDRGVFSHEAVDPGTRYLLQEAPTPPDAPPDDPIDGSSRQLLDLGCGYGPIAVTLARRCPHATVWAVDVNERAVGLARDNAARLGLANVRTLVAGDPAAAEAAGMPAEARFSAIWSNPPIRIGKAALHELLRAWLARLTPEGEAWLVAHKHLGSDSLARWLTDQGWVATRRSSRAGYRLLHVAAR